MISMKNKENEIFYGEFSINARHGVKPNKNVALPVFM